MLISPDGEKGFLQKMLISRNGDYHNGATENDKVQEKSYSCLGDGDIGRKWYLKNSAKKEFAITLPPHLFLLYNHQLLWELGSKHVFFTKS